MGVKIQKPGEPGHPGGNRRIYVRVNHGGRRLTRVFNTSKGAQDYAGQVEAYLKLGNLGAVFVDPAPPAEAPPLPTFAEAAQWFQDVDGARWKHNTRETYGGIIVKHLVPAFGPRPLAEITRADLESWWAALQRRGYSRKHLESLRGVLSGIFRRAVSRGMLPHNPAEAISGRLGREDREVRQAEWLTETELCTVLEKVEQHAPRHAPLLLTLASTGLRLGEALALQVGDLDLDRATVAIRRAIRKGHVGSPKSGRPRTADLPPTTVAVLRRWLNVVRAEAAVRGQEPSWLFPGPQGEPICDFTVRQAWRLCLKAAGIRRHVRLHDLRHTYASPALQRGVPLLVVSRQLGHASIAITVNVYGHLAPDATRQAADAWEAILTAPGRNPRATDGALPS